MHDIKASTTTIAMLIALLLILLSSSHAWAQRPYPGPFPLPTTLEINKSIVVRVYLQNNSATPTANWGFLDVSNPNPTRVDMAISNYSSDWDDPPSLFPTGSTIFHRNGSQITSLYPLVSAGSQNWSSYQNRWIELTFTARQTGDFYIYYRRTLNAYIEPTTSSFTDQQGWPVSRAACNVFANPDLVVSAASATPTSIPAGTSVSLTCTVRNSGVGSVGTSVVGYYLATQSCGSGTLLGEDSVISLAPGGSAAESESITIPATTAPGNYYLVFRADHESNVVESDETNNCRSVAVAITAPPTYIVSGIVASSLNSFDVIPNATVTIAGQSAISGPDGRYSVANVPVGTHTPEVSHAAYTFNPIDPVVVVANATRDITGYCRAQPSVTVTHPADYRPGTPYIITVTMRNSNYAVSGVPAYLDVSFPDISNASGRVSVTNSVGWTAGPSFINAGQALCTANSSSRGWTCGIPAQHLLVTAERTSTIYNGQDWSYTLTVVPPASGDLRFRVKSSIGDRRIPANGPAAGAILGQQNVWETEYVIPEYRAYTVFGYAASSLNGFDRIPGAAVTIAGYPTVVSGSDGYFEISEVAAGSHEVCIVHDAYIWTSSCYTINVTGPTRRDFFGACRAAADIEVTAPTDYVPGGPPVDITVALRNANYAVSGVSSFLDIAFPDLAAATDRVTLVSYAGFDAAPQFINAGTTDICRVNQTTGTWNCTDPAEHLLVTAQRTATAYFNTPWTYTVRVVPPASGDLRLRVKGNIADRRDPAVTGDGVVLGQQGFWEQEIIIPSREVYTVSGIARSSLNNFDVVAEATVSIPGYAPVTTDWQGRFQIPGVVAGNHTVSIIHSAFTWPDGSTRAVAVTGPTTVEFRGYCRAQPEIEIDAPSDYLPGATFPMTVTLRNTNYAVDDVKAFLDVSFPSLATATGCVEFVSQSGFDAPPTLYVPGGVPICRTDLVAGTLDCTAPADYLLVAVERTGTIHFNTDWTITLNITPPSDGPFVVHVKGSIADRHDPVDGGDGGAVIGQQGLWERVVTIASAWDMQYDASWMQIVDGAQTYDIRVASETPLGPISDRGLSMYTDAASVKSIYLGGLTVPITMDDRAAILMKAQSAGKLIDTWDYFAGHLDYAIAPFDRIGEWRMDNSGRQYPATVPSGTNGWWNDMFIFSELNRYDDRVDRYSDVILDLVLQPGLYSNLKDYADIAAKVNEAITAGKLATNQVVVNAIIVGDSAFNLTAEQSNEVWLKWMLTTRNPRLLYHIERIHGVLAYTSVVTHISAEAMRYLMMQCVANAEAEERMAALARWSAVDGSFDSAFVEGLENAQSELEDLIHNEWYEALGQILVNSVLDEGGVVTYGKLGLHIASHGFSIAFKKALLPYYLSWETWKLIRDQQQNAQWCVLGGTIWAQLATSAMLDDSPQRLSGPSKSIEEIEDVVHLLGMGQYASYMFYDKYFEISSNMFITLFGRMVELLAPAAVVAGYDEFIADLANRKQDRFDACRATAQPRYLAQYADAYDAESGDEASWLLGRLSPTAPILSAPPLVLPRIAATPTSGLAPLEIELTNNSLGQADEWRWYPGDGSVLTGAMPGFHQYAHPGRYVLTLEADRQGAIYTSAGIPVDVQHTPVVADFDASIRVGTAPLTVQFTDISAGVGLNYSWSFGSGAHSQQRNPSYTFNYPGTYTVVLQVCGPGGSDQKALEGYIVVSGSVGELHVTANLPDAPHIVTGPESHVGIGQSTHYESIPAGQYTVTFKPVVGYDTPPPMLVAVAATGSASVNGNYVPHAPAPMCFVSPTALHFEPARAPNNALPATIVVTNNGGGILAGELRPPNDRYEVIDGSYSLSAGQSKSISVTYRPDGCYGTVTDTIAADALCSEVLCNVVNDNYHILSALQDTLRFTSATESAPQSLPLKYRNDGCGDAVVRVLGQTQEFTFDSQFPGGEHGEHVVHVTYAPLDAGPDTTNVLFEIESTTTGGYWLTPATVVCIGHGPAPTVRSRYVAENGDDGNSGVSPALPLATIQRAVNLSAAGDTIILADGTYRGTGNRDIDLMGKNLVVRSAAGNPSLCVIDAESSEGNSHNGFIVNSGESQLAAIRGVTIRNCACGVVIGDLSESSPASPTISNCRVEQCGTGIWVLDHGSRPLISQSSLLGNRDGLVLEQNASGAVVVDCTIAGCTGDGVRTNGVDTAWGVVEITRCTIDGNLGSGVLNGAGFGRAHLIDTDVINNGAWGVFGATFMDNVLRVTGGSVSGNKGGGIRAGGWTAHVDSCLVSGNGGVGIAVSLAAPDLSIAHCIVTGNASHGVLFGGASAAYGLDAGKVFAAAISGADINHNGGIGVCVESGNAYWPILCVNSLIWNNTGGGISFLAQNGHQATFALEGMTISGNAYGVLLDTAMPVTIRRTAIVDNGGPAVDCRGVALPVVECSNIQGNAGGDWTACIWPQSELSGNLGKRPLFCDPANGGFGLQANSLMAAEYSTCGVIGARGVECPAPIVECRSVHVYMAGSDSCDASLFDIPMTVEGVVYVAPGTYSAGGGGYLQDATGGINFWRSNLPVGIMVGDRLRITGPLWPDNEMFYVGNYSYEVVGAQPAPVARSLTVGALLGDLQRAGDFVEIAGRVQSLTPDNFVLGDGTGTIEVRRNAYGGVSFASLAVGMDVVVRSPAIKHVSGFYLVPPTQAHLTAGVEPWVDITPTAANSGGVGVAWCDFDRDGDDDCYVVRESAPNALLVNNGVGVFTECTPGILADGNVGTSAAWADYNADGWPDLFLTNLDAPNRLFENRGPGSGCWTFVEVGTGDIGYPGQSVAARWVDVDRDGRLEIFVSNRDGDNQLLASGGGFGDVLPPSLRCGLATQGAAWADCDLDMDQDAYIVDEAGTHFLMLQRDDGTFDQRELTTVPGGQGCAWGDFNNDGLPDLYVTYWGAPNVLLRNLGNGMFTPVADPDLADTGRGQAAAWADYDNDGFLDLYIANFGDANRLLHNDGGSGQFTRVANALLADSGNTVGAAWSDIDGDGDLDLYFTNNGGRDVLARNNLASASGHWLKIKLRGYQGPDETPLSNREARGAVVLAIAGADTFSRQLGADDGYASQQSQVLHIGLGAHQAVDKLLVFWPRRLPNGAHHVSALEDVSVNQLLTVDEPDFDPSDVEPDELPPAPAFALNCHPNPFNPMTSISYVLPGEAVVDLAIYDPTGRLVVRLKSGAVEAAGAHECVWRGQDTVGRVVAAGVYICRLRAGSEVRTQTLTLVK